MASATLPVELTAKFSQLESHVRRIRVVRGLGIVAVVAAVSLGLAFFADMMWELGQTARWAILAGVGFVTVLTALRTILRPLFTRHTEEELAAVVETAHPRLRERLSSMVELNDPHLPEIEKGSPLMRELLARQTVRASRQLDFTDAVSPKRSLRWALAGAIAAFLLAVPFIFFSGTYGLLVSRFFAPWADFERPNNLFFEIPEGDRVVAHGSDVTIAALPRWRVFATELPDEVRLNWTDSTGREDSRPMDYDDESKSYTVTLPHVFDGFDYNVAAGRSRTANHRIEVAEAPMVVAASLEVEPPAYTGLPAASHDGVVGEIRVFERSRLSLHLEFNKPVETAQLEWLGVIAPRSLEIPVPPDPDLDGQMNDVVEKPIQREPLQAMSLAADRRSAQLDFTADLGGPFAFRLSDEHDLANDEEPVRVLIVAPDAAPILALADGDAQRVRPTDVVKIDVEATDDVGLGELELHYEQPGAEEPAVVAVPRVALGERKYVHTFRLDLAPLDLQPGVQVTYRVRAADERPEPEPNVTWSEQRTVTIDSTAKPPGSARLAAKQKELREELAQIRTDLDKNRSQTEDLKDEAVSDLRMQLDFNKNANIPPLAQEQNELAKRVEQLAEKFARHPLYGNLTKQTQSVARDELNPAGAQLAKAAELELKEKAPELVDNVEKLNRAADGLEHVEQEFEKLAEIERDLLELNRLAEEAARVADEALALEQQTTNPPADETPAERETREADQAGKQQELARQHAELSNQLDDLLNRRPELLDAARKQQIDRLAELSRQARELAEPQDRLADALKREAESAARNADDAARAQEELTEEVAKLAADVEKLRAEMNGDAVEPVDAEALRKAIDDLKQGNLKDAFDRQQAAAEELKRLAKELAKNSDLPDDPQAAANELKKRQEELQREIADAAKSAPAADAADQVKTDHQQELRNLAARQAAVQAGAAKLDAPARTRDQQQQAVDKAADATESLIAGDPEQAAQTAAETVEALDKLAADIGSREDRVAQAKRELAELKKRQEQLAEDAAKQAKAAKPTDAEAEPDAAHQDLARRQEQIARELADLDAPDAERQQTDAVRKSAAAIEDLKRQLNADVPASQADLDEALDRLEQQLAGKDVPEPAGDDRAQHDPAKLAAELAKRQKHAADAAQKQAEAGNVPAQQPRAQAAEDLDQIAEDAERLRVGDAAQNEKRQALDSLARAQEAREQVDQLAKKQQPNNDPPDGDDKSAPEAGDELKRLMKEEAQAQKDAADALEQMAQRLEKQDAKQQRTEQERREQEQAEQLAQLDPPADPARTAQKAAETAEQQAAREEAARRAEQLAERQQQLGEQVAGLQQGKPPGEQNPAGQQPGGEPGDQPGQQPGDNQPGPNGESAATPAQAVAGQQKLARDAAELAIDAARQQGPTSEAAQSAADFARKAGEASKAAQSGRLDDAQQSAQEAAASAGDAAKALTAEPDGELGPRAQSLAKQQEAQAEQFGRQAGSPGQRKSAQAAGQEHLADAAEDLSKRLDDVAKKLTSQPLDDQPTGREAQSARDSVQNAEKSMKQASGEMNRGNDRAAADSAKQAADALRQAAGDAEQAAGENPPPDSPVPGEIGEQVTDAARNLREAGEQLARAPQGTQPERQPGAEPPNGDQPPGEQPGGEQASAQPGMGKDGEGQPGNQPGESQPGEGQRGSEPGAQASQQGSPAGQPQPGQPGQGQSNGTSPSPLAKSAQSLKQAAQALARAAQQSQPGRSPGGPPSGSGQPDAQGQPGGQQASADGQSQPGGEGGGAGGGSGTGAQVEADLSRLESELKKLSGRDWGQLPGHLRTEIIQAARRRPNSDYSKLIKLYFEEIARTPKQRER